MGTISKGSIESDILAVPALASILESQEAAINNQVSLITQLGAFCERIYIPGDNEKGISHPFHDPKDYLSKQKNLLIALEANNVALSSILSHLTNLI